MPLIEITRLTFGYDGGGADVFADTTLQWDSTWRVGLCGRNGRGKTTLLRLLEGTLTPDGGRISMPAPGVYCPAPLPDPSRVTRAVLRDLVPAAEDWRWERELSLLSLREDALGRPFDTLSGGEQTKVLLAALFLREDAAYPLIDEPTNHLDAPSRAAVAAYLAAQHGFLLVSHDRAFLDACTDHTLAINPSGFELVAAPFSVWYADKQARDAGEAAENERLRGEVRRLEQTAREKAQWAQRTEASKIGDHAADRGFIGHRAAKMMKRGKQIEQRARQAAADKAQLLRDVETAQPLRVDPPRYHSPRLVTAHDLRIPYAPFAPLRLTLERGQRLALVGANGSGKSSILRLVLQAAHGESEIPHVGTLTVGGGLRVSYVPQEVSAVAGSWRDFLLRSGADETRLRTLLHKLDVPRAALDRPLDTLSLGQKKKLLLAAGLCADAHLLLWDEPLNYVDVFSRIQLEELLQTDGLTMLFVEHDAAFVAAVATGQVTVDR